MMERISVVLPAPLRPTRLTMAPRFAQPNAPWLRGSPGSKSREAPASTEFRPPDGRPRAGESPRSLRAPGDVAAHFRVLQHITRLAIGENPALVKGHHTVGIAADDLHVVFDENDGCGIRRDGVDHAIHG